MMESNNKSEADLPLMTKKYYKVELTTNAPLEKNKIMSKIYTVLDILSIGDDEVFSLKLTKASSNVVNLFNMITVHFSSKAGNSLNSGFIFLINYNLPVSFK